MGKFIATDEEHFGESRWRIMKVKIAQVCPRYYPYIGGVETRVREVSERLVKKSFEVDVLTTDPAGELPKEEVINDVKVRRFQSWAPSEAYYISRSLKKYLAENSEDYDVVDAHSYHAFPALYVAQTKGRNKLVFTPHYHGKGHTFFRSLLHIPYRNVAKKIFEKADRVVCVSNYERSLVIKDFKVNKRKVVLIPNGINPKDFEELENKKENNSKILLSVGRLEKYKGVDSLIKALPKCEENICLEIIGKGTYKKALLKLINRLGVIDKVRFYQDLSREELLQKYAEADLFVCLSKYEAFGINVAEALASKTPCIVANSSALREWIDNKNCFGVDYPVDVDELMKLMNKVIDRQVKDIEFPSWDEVVEKLTGLYRGYL